MERKAIVILEEYVLKNLINHSENNPEIECGGFLFGRIAPIKDGVIHCHVNGIYSHYGIPASDENFEFREEYLRHANNWGEKENLQIIGIYHSHVVCQPTPSKQDLKLYNTFFPMEGLSIIYNPSQGIHADYICRDAVIVGNDIYVKHKDGSYEMINNIFDHSHTVKVRRRNSLQMKGNMI